MKNFIAIFLLALTASFSFFQAQPPIPGTPPGGGTGGTTPGVPASPIDSDLWILLAAGLIFMIIYAVRYRKMSSVN